MIQQYLSELSKIRLLEPDEELKLWRQYKLANCRASRQQIIEAYQPLVYKIATQITHSQGILFDLIQEGTVGLIESVERFDLAKSVKFSVYATHRIRGRMIDYLKRHHSNQEFLELALYQDEVQDVLALVADENVNVAEEVADKTIYSQVQAAIARLNSKEQQVIRDLYLLDKEPLTSAQEMNISVSYYYKLQKKALQRLRGMLSKLRSEIKLSG